ncbi:MAG TPA: alpha/beta hydrolase [Candidatus Limnocylindria bacterium]|nr:alpha/beta hydrolase [Candidatus Limnocylindria bacterium]
MFRHLAKVLPPVGVAVGRFDRRGYDVPLDDQADDALAFVSELEVRPDIDASHIGLWGFSQGAWVAPLAASRSKKVAFLVLLASTGVTPAEQMQYGTAKHVRMAGYGEDAAGRVVELRQLVDEWRRGRVPIERAQAELDRARREPWFEQAYLPERLSAAKAWPDMDFEPAEVFAKVTVPVLLFYGEDDEWQPIDASVAAWRRAAERAGNADLTIVRLAGTGHAPTIGDLETVDAVAPEYERALLEWLRRVARLG